jgi:hypothetical protein
VSGALIPLMYLAALGFLLSALAHCLAVANVSIPGGDMIFALHVGIFVVWIPTVLVSNSATRMVGRRDFWKVALAGCPAWMRWMLYTLLGYAVVNFVYCMAYLGMGRNHVMPMRERGTYVLRPLDGVLFYGVRGFVFANECAGVVSGKKVCSGTQGFAVGEVLPGVRGGAGGRVDFNAQRGIQTRLLNRYFYI